MLERKHEFAMLAFKQHPRVSSINYMFSDITTKALSHTKTLVTSNPRYSVKSTAGHPHSEVREVGTHPGEHTESVTALPGPDFICPYLKVTGDNCLKASAVFLHAYICLPDPG